jgi:cell division septation protein DedD
VAEASRVTGTESPAEAGADFARPDAPAPQVAPQQAPVVVARADPPPPPVAQAAPSPVPAPRAARPTPAAGAGGPYRVQLGAFSVAGNADKLWAQLSSRPELAGKTKLAIPAGRVTKLQAGGFATQGDAEAACRRLRGAGQECIVTTR